MNQIPKCTLVPARFCDEKDPRCFLLEVASLEEGEQVSTIPVPKYDAVLVYSGDQVPELYEVLMSLSKCTDYNKILASIKDGWLSLAVAKGNSLEFANIFKANSFTTAEYFIFSVVKSLQMNLEMSTICFLSKLTPEEEMSLYQYVKTVDQF